MWSYANNNAEAIKRISEIYIPTGSLVLDATFGKGRFWAELLDAEITVVAQDINPALALDVCGDFRRLPFHDQVFDVGVFDPPYYGHGTAIKEQAAASASRQNVWFVNPEQEPIRNLYLKGLMELSRVVRNKGIIVVKCTNGCDYSDMPTWLRGLRIGRVVDEVVCINPAIRNWHGGEKKKLRTAHSYFLVIQNAYYGRIE